MMTTYKVTLIPPNLRNNETIIQIADSLDLLSRVVDDIMTHIEQRVDQYKNKLNSVSNRVKNVENNIEKLKRVKNAVQVFSSSKYPASDIPKNYISIFPTDSEIRNLRHGVSPKYPLKKDEPFDKLHIYHVKLNKPEAELAVGLGHIPNDINFISDLILYNTGRNPYREFISTKTPQLTISPTKIEHNKVEIGSAPVSITEKTFLNLPNQEYFYSPDLGDVPSLDIPVDLPDLPGIASNVRYQEDTNVVIAPSVALPVVQTNSSEEPFILDENLQELPEIVPSETPHIDEVITHIEKIESKEEIPLTITHEVSIETKIKKQPEESASKLAAVLDTRASLMEAIREAGGKKVLKSVTDSSTSVKNELSGGDLMADLHSKLALRRKGISGAKKNIENSELDSRGTLSLMSALIPPPDESNEETDQEEDWE